MAAGGVGLQRESLFLFFAPGWLISAGGFSYSRGRIEHYIGHFAGHCSTTVGVSHAPRRWDTDADRKDIMVTEEQYAAHVFPYYDGAGMIHCPVCDSEYVHMSGASIDRGGDKVVVDHDGVGFIDLPQHYRGAVVEIEMYCEFSEDDLHHRFLWRTYFHKGTIYVKVERLPDSVPPPDLWRD